MNSILFIAAYVKQTTGSWENDQNTFKCPAELGVIAHVVIVWIRTNIKKLCFFFSKIWFNSEGGISGYSGFVVLEHLLFFFIIS